MGILFTILSALAAISCFINPVWGFCAFVATIIIRPNEQFDGVMLPAVPLMIVATCISYLIHSGRTLPPPQEGKAKSTPLMMIMLALLGVHLLIWRSFELVDWILSEAAPFILLLLFMTRHMSTMNRLNAVFTTITASSSVVTGIPFFIHFFYKGKKRFKLNQFKDKVVSYGWIWDMYHLDAERLQGKAKGTWGNSNDLGMLANWAIAGSLYYLRRKGSKFFKIFWLALLGMLVSVIMLTGSRGGQLQLGVTLWMFFVGGKRKALGIILLVIALTGVVFVLPKLSPERADANASANERKMLLERGVEMFLWNPIKGVGYNSFGEHTHRHLLAHNVYMQCLAETGLIGSSIFFPLIIFLRRETSRAAKYFEGKENNRITFLSRAIGALQFSFSVFIFFSNQFMRFTFGIPMTTAVAMFWAMQRDKELPVVLAKSEVKKVNP